MVNKGSRYGCSNKIMAISDYGMSIQIDNETTLYTLRFVEDQVIIAQDRDDLRFIVDSLI